MFFTLLLLIIFTTDASVAQFYLFCFWFRYFSLFLPPSFFFKFVVATNDIFKVNIVVLVVTVVVASLTVIHINVKLQPLLQLFFLDTCSHQITEVQNPFFTECSPNLFCFFLDVSLTATLK